MGKEGTSGTRFTGRWRITGDFKPERTSEQSGREKQELLPRVEERDEVRGDRDGVGGLHRGVNGEVRGRSVINPAG